ncbi:MAG: alpha-amylase family glycosyl hydrolase [Pseudomonadota bacterium]
MVESFVDGDPAFNYGTGYGTSHHRGDLAGITASLDWIASTGATTLWLTPIFDSDAGAPQDRLTGDDPVDLRLDATGYFARDYFNIDPKFGTASDLKTLVREAEARGLEIMFDGVFGHHKGAVAPSPSGVLPKDLETARDYSGGAKNYPGRLVDWSSTESLAFYQEFIRYWADEFGVVSWRLDQVYQTSNSAWIELIRQMQDSAAEIGKPHFHVGENWTGADGLADLFGSNDAPALTALFDFPTRYALVQALAVEESGAGKKPATILTEDWALHARERYPDHAVPVGFLGNHDLVRFGDLLQRGGLGGPETAAYWDRHRLAFAYLAAYSGPIAFYYGEELGVETPNFTGRVEDGCAEQGLCDDHAARTSGVIPGVTHDPSQLPEDANRLFEDLQKLLQLRRQYPSLSMGAREHLYADEAIYADLKSLDGEKILFVMNITGTPKTLEISTDLIGDLTDDMMTLWGPSPELTSSGDLSLEIDGLASAIIRL